MIIHFIDFFDIDLFISYKTYRFPPFFLKTVWMSTIKPIGKKESGSAVGFIGETARGDRWLVKLGMDKTEGHKATPSILTRSIVSRGISTDAIMEFAATAAFRVSC